ncbi:MAG: phnC [Herminiimonas sp.]|jgi:phosphonate transport system ATP-binding protein|nr:phnC [Herminiimonas sp.]
MSPPRGQRALFFSHTRKTFYMNAFASNTESGFSSLVIRNLVKEYAPGKPVLKNISLTFDKSELVAIIGPSGTGKSTLIRCVNRLVEPTSGAILLDGKDLVTVRGKALREARRSIGMVFQEYNLVERLTVMENLLTGRLGYTSAFNAWLRRFTAEDIRRAFEMLEVVGLSEFANQRADSLSGGQRQRVGISRAVMQGPSLILADEPTSSLDPKTSVEIMELLQRVARAKNIPVIVNMHDVELAKRFASRIIGMSNGHVVYDGPPAGLGDDRLKQIYGGESWLQ